MGNKTNYEGYPPSFINPLNKNYFDFKNLMMKVDYLLNDNTNCRSNNRIQGRVGQRVHLESHSMKAHVMGGRVDNKPLSVRKAYCLGQNTHPHIHTLKHTTPQPAMKAHSLERVSQPYTLPSHSKAMYVKNPKFHFGYHSIGHSNNCNSFNSNYSLGLSKTIYSTKKPHNNLSTSNAIKPKKQPGRFYPQENIHSNRKKLNSKKDLQKKAKRTVNQNKRIPRVLPNAH